MITCRMGRIQQLSVQPRACYQKCANYAWLWVDPPGSDTAWALTPVIKKLLTEAFSFTKITGKQMLYLHSFAAATCQKHNTD